MILPRAILSTLVAVASAVALTGAQELSPCLPVGELLQGTNVLRALLSRQTCSDPGYGQCPGYAACCPSGGNCCSEYILLHQNGHP